MSQTGKFRCDPGEGEEGSRERGDTEGRVGKGEGREPAEDQGASAAHSGTPPRLGCQLLLSEQDAGTPCQELTWGSELG